MQFTDIDLSMYFPLLENVILTAYIPDNNKLIDEQRRNPAVVILPGGGYAMTSHRTAEPVALRFLAAGYCAFVLHYSCIPVRYPMQLLQASAAISYIKGHNEELLCYKDKIAVVGFSAGGHLAASLGVHWDDYGIAQKLNIERGSNRPDAMVLCYSPLVAGEFENKVTISNLFGTTPGDDERALFSPEIAVNSGTPETFLWHTYDDNLVLVENTLLFANALRAHAIKFDLHIYRDGIHSLSLANNITQPLGKPGFSDARAATWFPLCISWLERVFDLHRNIG